MDVPLKEYSKMGVVIDNQQWEQCCQCGTYVKYQELEYGPIHPKLTPAWPEYKNLDLCRDCIHPAYKRTTKP